MVNLDQKADTVIEREVRLFEGKDSYSVSELIVDAARKSGRGAFSIGREMVQCSFGKGKLKPSEYVLYEFYDKEKYTSEERDEFVSASMHGKIVYEFNDYGWFEVAGDKWLSSVFLSGDNTPQPETIAVIDTSHRGYQTTKKLSTPDDLRDFLCQQWEFPLFCKFNNGRWSVGANIITSAEKSHLFLKGEDPITYEQFFEQYVGEHAFLIQKFVKNHSFLSQYTTTTATVRLVNIWRSDGLWTPYAILKLPSDQNAADNFWRSGNMVCQVEVATGKILSLVGRDGPGLVRYERHPGTKLEILGKYLPHWDKVRQLNERVANFHHPIKYQSQDIAITEDGPVVIEFNWGGAFELPQIATGAGFLTQEMREAFRSFGSSKM